MTDEERTALSAHLDGLRRKLEARRNQPGFAANVVEIEQHIAEIEALQASAD